MLNLCRCTPFGSREKESLLLGDLCIILLLDPIIHGCVKASLGVILVYGFQSRHPNYDLLRTRSMNRRSAPLSISESGSLPGILSLVDLGHLNSKFSVKNTPVRLPLDRISIGGTPITSIIL